MTDPGSMVLASVSAMAAGAVNALAGGGTLITFPTLVALGLPAVAANVTSSVALCPGYLGATLAQAKDLKGQRGRLLRCLPAAALGGLLGGILLLNTGEKLFRALVPFLLLLASGLLALQGRLRGWISREASGGRRNGLERWVALPVGLGAIYGGYFGAGLSVIVLAVLAVLLEDTLTRLNALKQAIALAVNVSAAGFFLFSDQLQVEMAAVMALGALAGGVLGGKLAGKVRPETLRWTVVTIGLLVALVYLF